MINLFSKIKPDKKQEAKKAVLREFFSYSSQKKAIEKAARESAKDQRLMVEKYNRFLRAK